jgi:hypothetical protein
MRDALFLFVTIAFFALMAAYARGCSRLGSARAAYDDAMGGQ